MANGSPQRFQILQVASSPALTMSLSVMAQRHTRDE